MTEKQYKKLLKTLGIGTNKSNVEVRELLDAKLNEYLDRTDAEAEQKVSDIQDALDYVEDLIEKMGGGIALAPADGGKNAKNNEESQKVLGQAAKKNKKEAVTYTSSADASGQNANVGAGAGTSGAQGVNPKGKAWYYSLYGDQKVDAMFEMAEGDLKQGDFQHAKIVFDMILQIEVTNPGAYLGKVLAEHKLNSPKNLATCRDAGLENDPDLKRAISSANPAQKKFIQDALEERRLAGEYLNALGIFKGAFKTRKIRDFQGAESLFLVLGDYRDAKEKVEDCRKEIERLRKEEEERARQEEIRRKIEESKRREAEERKKKEAEEEAKRKEIERKQQEKQNKKNRIMVIGMTAALLLVLGFFFYRNNMTSTYYGTGSYIGAKMNYEEYTIADTVKTIAPHVFEGMKMESIVIPDSVESIGAYAFADCTNLKSIVIPSSVKNIDEGAFSGCVALETVTFGDNLTVIGDNAFADCAVLKEVNFPNSLTEIGASTFEGCTTLNKVKLPNALTQIGDRAFAKCYLIKEVVFDAESDIEFGTEVFADCVSMETLLLPDVESESTMSGNIISNCRNLDFDETVGGRQGFDSAILYVKPVEGFPLLENERQLKNAVWGKTFDEPTIQEQECISSEGIISNIQIGEEMSGSNGRYVNFTFDYQEYFRLMHLSGTMGEDGVTILLEGTDVDYNLLLAQDENGNYPLMQKLLAGKEFIDEYENSYIFQENELVFREVAITEGAHEVTGEPFWVIDFSFDANRKLGAFAVTGSIKIMDGDVNNVELVMDSIKLTDFTIDGTYEGNGTITVRHIGAGYYAITMPESTSYGAIFCKPDSWWGGESWLTWNDDTYVGIDYNSSKIRIHYHGGTEYFTKVSDLSEDVSYDSKLAGVWTGTYMDKEQTRQSDVTKYVMPIGENLYASVFDYTILEKGVGMKVLEVLTYDEENDKITCKAKTELYRGDFVHPATKRNADFAGSVNADGTEMVGEPSEECSYYFKLTKTGELEDLSDVLQE